MTPDSYQDQDFDRIGDEKTPEQVMYQAVVLLRKRGIKTQCITAQAVIDVDLDDDGRWDQNPDNFGGGEPGNFTIRTFDGDRQITEVSELSLIEGEIPSSQQADPEGLALWIANLHEATLAGGQDS